jgi:hypothetical protein
MKHIVNSQNIRKLIDYNVKNKIHNVVITTPKMFMGVTDNGKKH